MNMKKVTVYLGAAKGNDEKYAANAYRLGMLLAGNGHTIVYGGSDVGCMKALADGAQMVGGDIIGVFPQGFKGSMHAVKLGLKVERTDLQNMVYVADFAERKKKMEELGDCFVIMPGAFGSLDELFTCACNRALRKHLKPIYVLDTNGYYAPLQQMINNMFNCGFIVEELRTIIKFIPTVEGIIEEINSL